MPPAAAALDKTSRLKVGDRVSTAVSTFGEEYARGRGANPWRSEAVRDEGVIVGRGNGSWKVRFSDGEYSLVRRALSLVAHGERHAEVGTTRRAPAVVESDDESENDRVNPQAPTADSSDEDEGVGAPEHDGGSVPSTFESRDEEWRRDDSYGFDERARHNFTDRSGPRIAGLPSWESASLFSLAEYFLPVTFLRLMAKEMQAVGKKKFYDGDRNYANFDVSYEDVLQWIGVWLYMLAFPQTGDRRLYFQEPLGGFGPRHRLADWLRLAGNGEKGLQWFEKMDACFQLPVYSRQEFRDAGHRGDIESDPFRATRRHVHQPL